MDPFEIRPARPEEADAIHAITQAAYAEYSATPAPSSALAETAREVRERMWRGEFRVAVVEREGTMAASVRYKLDANGLYFFRLAVHPDWRGNGIAKKLVGWLENEARAARVHRIWCQVRLIVPRNVALYESLGFALIERHVVMRGGTEVPTGTMEKRLGREPAPRLASATVMRAEE
jgi:ribosomal protein S18 acetylase RimI-like enzyme